MGARGSGPHCSRHMVKLPIKSTRQGPCQPHSGLQMRRMALPRPRCRNPRSSCSAADQMPQVTTPLLILPLNQLAQLPAARAHGENAENAQEGCGLRMSDQRRITREIMRGWAPHSDARENGAPQPRAMALHLRHATQIFDCISRTLEGQPGHSRLQATILMKKNSIARPTSAKRSPGRQTLF